jgi:hypothetical protein
MKNLSISAFTLGITYFFIQSVQAQDCSTSLMTNKGASIEVTEFDAARAEKSKKLITVTEVQTTDKTVTSKAKSVKTEKNGTISENKVFTYRCTDQGVEWGIGADNPKTNKELFLKYPVNMSPGMTITPDVVYEISQKDQDGNEGKVTVKITNRKVAETADITVKAGSWKCTKLTYDFSLKIKIGLLSIPVNAKMSEWYNPEVGIVRSETWIKGKMESYSEITSLTK